MKKIALCLTLGILMTISAQAEVLVYDVTNVDRDVELASGVITEVPASVTMSFVNGGLLAEAMGGANVIRGSFIDMGPVALGASVPMEMGVAPGIEVEAEIVGMNFADKV